MLNVLPPHGGSGEGVWILIMKYIKPNTVDGGDALTKENKWDIFGDEDTTEE